MQGDTSNHTTNSKNSLRFSIHYFSYLWLYFSMVMVVMIRDGLSFLIVWEIMALSSFLLVIFDAEDTTIMKTGISYLIQMHVGMFFLMIAFLIVGRETGEMSFDALQRYFSGHSNLLLFILFFIGFGIKAGFIPFHTWLPQAHPAAPFSCFRCNVGCNDKNGNLRNSEGTSFRTV